MKTMMRYLLLAATTALLACSAPREQAGSSADALDRAPSPQVSRRAADLTRAAKMAAMRRLARVEAIPKVGGVLNIFDDQLGNHHGTQDSFFFDDYVPLGCTDVIPIEGGECLVAAECNPPQPPFNPNLVTVGTLEIAATYDTLRIEPNFIYAAVDHPGPFWRGDGDFVSLSVAGDPRVAPAWSTRMRAPVADAVATIPPSIDRSVPLPFEWRYAIGSESAVGDLILSISQSQTDPSLNAVCVVPFTQRRAVVPESVLQRFGASAATISMASAAAETFDTYVEAGAMKLVVSLTGAVDIGQGSPNEPNVVFR
jgi:hypothetical protein